MTTRLAAFSLALLLSLPATASPFELTILHTNDLHSRIEPINKFDAACSAQEAAEKACFGGVARLATAIRDRRAAHAHTLLVDAGDQFQGSLFFTYYKGMDSAEFMDAIGYDAMAVGNHEFDDGPAMLDDFAKGLKFPLLSANLDLAREPDLQSRVAASTVRTVGGERIGIIGLTPQDTGELTIGGQTVGFTDPVEAATREAAKLAGKGVNKIILLSHSGYEADKRLAASVPGVDVIVGGHSHTLLSNTDPKAGGPYPTRVKGPDGTAVPIVQAGAYGRYLGELTVTFDGAGRVAKAEGAPILLDASIPEDAEIKARVTELARPLEEIRGEVVGRTAAAVDGSRETCRSGECQMGDLVAEAMLDRVKNQGVTIAITNGGGLRASVDAGDVTMGEVLTVLPFQNTLATFQLKGADVVAALENGVSQVETGGGRFPQVAGLQFDWSRAGTAGVDRIRAVRVRQNGEWVPIDPDATYLVVANNFMRGGGDGYKVFAEKAGGAYDFGPNLEEALIAFLTKSNGPYVPSTDGRIREMN